MDENKANTQARVAIIKAGGEQIASKMNVSLEYVEIATEKHIKKIIREQINLDKIVAGAIKESSSSKIEDSNVKEISSDWINAFEKEACTKDSDEMRLLFSKILAEEIKAPSSYSIRTIRLLSQLDNKAAELFQNFCSLTVSAEDEGVVVDGRVISLGGNASNNSLKSYGLSFSDLNTLQECGLIISNYNSSIEYNSCIIDPNNNVAHTFKYQGHYYVLRALDGFNRSSNFKVSGVSLSQSGKELLQIIDLTPSSSYTDALVKYFKNQKLEMCKLP